MENGKEAKDILYRYVKEEEPMPTAGQVRSAQKVLFDDSAYQKSMDELVGVVYEDSSIEFDDEWYQQLYEYVEDQLSSNIDEKKYSRLRQQLDMNVDAAELYGQLYETMLAEFEGRLLQIEPETLITSEQLPIEIGQTDSAQNPKRGLRPFTFLLIAAILLLSLLSLTFRGADFPNQAVTLFSQIATIIFSLLLGWKLTGKKLNLFLSENQLPRSSLIMSGAMSVLLLAAGTVFFGNSGSPDPRFYAPSGSHQSDEQQNLLLNKQLVIIDKPENTCNQAEMLIPDNLVVNVSPGSFYFYQALNNENSPLRLQIKSGGQLVVNAFSECNSIQPLELKQLGNHEDKLYTFEVIDSDAKSIYFQIEADTITDPYMLILIN